jgi:hypothetical protein
MNLSKSRYTTGVTCSKKLWLSCYKKEEACDTGNDAVLENGNKVGDLARSLFGEYKLINFDTNFQNMIDETNKLLENKPNIICEASFSYENNFCSVDILKNDIDGVELYEVKSSTKVEDIYIEDITYQTWVLKKCGLNVKKSYLVHINNKYVKNGELDINELFHIEDLTDILKLDEVESKVSELKEIINKKEEPNIDLSSHCHSPYDCPFFKYCTKNLPSPNVFDLGWGLSFDKKIDMYKRGSITFKDVLDKEKVNDKVLEQIKYTLNNLEPKINKESIKSFMSTLKYPLYFLDFESYQDSIPTIDGTKPYQQLCFQYSLHYLLEEDGELYHKEFLSDDYNGNPMYGLCKELCVDIPLDSCVLVYNQTFEKSRLNEMANMFPEFSEHLLNIKDNIIDLAVPFSKQDYYIKEMGGKYSIKYVLPALYPNDPTLDYHNLDQVHKGDEASNAYLSLKNLSKEEQDILRNNMLKYCCLDTYAMVKLYEVLKQI